MKASTRAHQRSNRSNRSMTSSRCCACWSLALVRRTSHPTSRVPPVASSPTAATAADINSAPATLLLESDTDAPCERSGLRWWTGGLVDWWTGGLVDWSIGGLVDGGLVDWELASMLSLSH